MSTLVYFLVLLPLALLSVGISMLSLYRRKNSDDLEVWEKHHRNHCIAQAISIPLLIMVGYYGTDIISQF